MTLREIIQEPESSDVVLYVYGLNYYQQYRTMVKNYFGQNISEDEFENEREGFLNHIADTANENFVELYNDRPFLRAMLQYKRKLIFKEWEKKRKSLNGNIE